MQHSWRDAAQTHLCSRDMLPQLGMVMRQQHILRTQPLLQHLQRPNGPVLQGGADTGRGVGGGDGVGGQRGSDTGHGRCILGMSEHHMPSAGAALAIDYSAASLSSHGQAVPAPDTPGCRCWPARR